MTDAAAAAEQKKRLVRATLVFEAPIDAKSTVLQTAEYLETAIRTVTGDGVTKAKGKLELVKVSSTGKESRTKLGDV